MSNKTVYPYGTGGGLPSSVGIINDLTTGGANKALSAQQGVVIGDALGLSTILNPASVPGSISIDQSVLSNGTWSLTDADTLGYIVPITPGIELTFTNNSEGNCIIAFLTSDSHTAQSSVDFSTETGFTSRIVVALGTSETYTVPSDATYFFILAKSATNRLCDISLPGGDGLIQQVDSLVTRTNSIPTASDRSKNVLSVSENCIYSWWTYPLSITTKYSFRRHLVSAWTDNEGNIGVTSRSMFDNTITRTIVDTCDSIDDHNAPAVIELADGRIAVIYTLGHAEKKYIYARVSTSAGNFTDFSARVSVSTTATTTYIQVFLFGSTYYIFSRIGLKNWGYVTTTDFVTFSSPHILITASYQYYIKFAKVTDNDDVLRMAMYCNPSYSDTGIRLGFIDFSSGNVYNNTMDAGNIVGTLTGSSIANTAFTAIIQAPISGTQRLFDVAETITGRTVIAFCLFDTNDTTTSQYYIYDNGTRYLIGDGGPFFYSIYQGGISFRDGDTAILSRSDSERDYIEMWEKGNNGWIRKYSIFDELREEFPIRNIRPIFDADKMFVLWQRGRYDPLTYTDFEMDTISILY